MKKGKLSTSLRNPTSPQRISMLRSAPCENQQKQVCILEDYCKILNKKLKTNLLILRASTSQKTKEIWLENWNWWQILYVSKWESVYLATGFGYERK